MTKKSLVALAAMNAGFGAHRDVGKKFGMNVKGAVCSIDANHLIGGGSSDAKADVTTTDADAKKDGMPTGDSLSPGTADQTTILAANVTG